MRRPAVIVVAVSAALFGAAGAAQAGSVELPLQVGGAFSIKVTSLKEARFAATVRQQHDFSCGSAALATLLSHHYGQAVDEQQVFAEMWDRGDQARIRREGFSMLDMKRYLQARGFEADGFEAPLDSLAQAAIPAVVLVNESGYNHFVVVKGVRDGRVLIGDPAGGTRAMPVARFEALRVNPILFVIGNHGDQARFNLAADWAALPAAPLAGRRDAAGLSALALPKLGAGDF